MTPKSLLLSIPLLLLLLLRLLHHGTTTPPPSLLPSASCFPQESIFNKRRGNSEFVYAMLCPEDTAVLYLCTVFASSILSDLSSMVIHEPWEESEQYVCSIQGSEFYSIVLSNLDQL